VRSRLTEVLGVSGLGVSMVLTPSGTDAVLHALFLARALDDGPLHSVLIAPDETGSGVPYAAAGRHPDALTAGGVAVDRHMPIHGFGDGLSSTAIAVRNADGSASALQEIDERVRDATKRALAEGKRVLLIVMDCSKLGTGYPSRACLDDLASRADDRLLLLVDACQGRISSERLSEHLQQGRMVMLTGSKFFCGPSFSGALLVPEALAGRCAALREVPCGLRDYASAHAWPRSWTGVRAALPEVGNDGLVLRWMAALSEMRAYAAVPAAYRREHLLACAASLRQGLGVQDEFVPLAVPAPLASAGGSDAFPPTIVPFLLRHQGAIAPFDACLKVYRALCAQGIAIGQPVRVGSAGALRLCTDARQVASQWASGRAACDTSAFISDLGAVMRDIVRCMTQIDATRDAIGRQGPAP